MDGVRPAGRVWPAVIGLGLLLVAFVAGLAFVLTRELAETRDREIRAVAIERAQLANELGAVLPVLTREKLNAGFTVEELQGITAALERLRETQPLRGFTIFDSRRRLVYPSAPGLALEVPDGIDRALAGEPAVEQTGGSEDPALQAAVPIRDVRGDVIGGLVVELDEGALYEEVEKERERLVLTLIVAAALLWLVLLPVAVRMARAAAPYVSVEGWRKRRGVRRALTAGELELHYQPKIALSERKPCGAEGLVRWRRRGELVPPGEFLAFLERSELVHELTDWVLDRAAGDAARWRGAGHDLGVAVNLSPRSLVKDDLPARVEAVLTRHGLDGSALTIEVTEHAVFSDPPQVESVLERIAKLGVSVSVDDFGTGHASLARLGRLPIHEVKIDRSFVARMTSDERPFVEAMATLADALGLVVVAEGVEDLATLELLDRTRCQTAQGFFFCRPVPLDAFLRWLESPLAGDIGALAELGVDHESADVGQLVDAARRISGGDVAWLARHTDDEPLVDEVSGDPEFFGVGADRPRLVAKAYCERMIDGEIPNAIDDARAHPATRGLRETGDIDIGAYVGVPVRMRDGRLYGSLCSVSRGARPATPETVRMMSVLAVLIAGRLAAENRPPAAA